MDHEKVTLEMDHEKSENEKTVKRCNSVGFHAIWLKFFLAVALFAGLGIVWIFFG